MTRSEQSSEKRSRKRRSGQNPKPARKKFVPHQAETDQMLHDLLHDLEIGVANVTSEGKILYSNPRFALTLGAVSHRDLTGLNIHSFIAPHGWGALDSALRQATEKSVVGEIKLDALADKTHTVRLSLSPARVRDTEIIRIVADEVTELVETNLHLRETEASLRTLSARILQIQDQERRRMARDLHDTTGQELAVLVMSLRHLAESIERPGLDVRKALVEAAELAQKVNDEIRTLSYVLHPPLLDQMGLGSALRWYVEGFHARSGVEVRLVIPEALQRFSSEKETALFRVVQEGLTNVLRHSGSKRAKIVVCASIDEVELTVNDEGKGLSTAELEHLAPGASSKLMGVGIAGLRERLHQLGGKLEISSNRAGTTLRANLPLEESEARIDAELLEIASRGAAETDAVSHTNGRKRILIVDDHEVMRRGIRGLLQDYTDLEVCGEAADGTDAVRKTRELDPDLIILDLNMPGSGGLSAANQLQSFDCRAKILVFTTHSFPGLERMLRLAGCKGMVSKVHAERDLLRGVRALLAGEEFFSFSVSSARAAHSS
jgi:PAS domain S-box-containing protein